MGINNKPDEFVLEEIVSSGQDNWEDWEWRDERERVTSKSSTAWFSSLRWLFDGIRKSFRRKVSLSEFTSIIGGKTN